MKYVHAVTLTEIEDGRRNDSVAVRAFTRRADAEAFVARRTRSEGGLGCWRSPNHLRWGFYTIHQMELHEKVLLDTISV